MAPELGQYALVLAILVAVVQAIVPQIGAYRRDAAWMGVAPVAARAQFLLVLFAFGCLMTSFIASDFSVVNVFENSHSLKPMIYKISGVWGNHEGSLLLWILILTLFGAAVAQFGQNLPPTLQARVLSVQAMIGVGFLAFILFTSNPFARLDPAPFEGAGLNPLLQDPALAIHPPFLYLGYVGLSVAFSFAVAALIEGRVDPAWARWVRPWTLAAWCCLTAGIALGSYWAYYELGWGGWWFWDPVENASFMPWLIGTALVHSLIVTEKRGTFRNWTVLLSIFAFSLSLLGTFIVRSGVLTSVHSFAADPSRGMFILLLLGLAIGGSLTLFAFRASEMASPAKFELWSKETMLLVCNLMLTVACGTVLLGTLYPLLIDALGMGKISVGPPYFNAVFVPIILVMFVFMGIGPIIRWKKAKAGEVKRQLLIPAIVSAVVGIAAPFIAGGEFNIWVALGIGTATWITLASLRAGYNIVKTNEGLSLARLGRSQLGMIIAHLGIAVSVVGGTMVSNYSIEKSVRMGPGVSHELAGYTFKFVETKNVVGPNYTAQQGQIEVYKGDKQISLLQPDRRQYNVRTMDMTEAGIDWGVFRDLYVTMGDPISATEYAVRLNYKPFVRWLWFGGIFMMVGGFFAASDKRYRVKAAATAADKDDGKAKLATA